MMVDFYNGGSMGAAPEPTKNVKSPRRAQTPKIKGMAFAKYKDSPFNSWYDFKKHYAEWHKTRLCKLIYLVSTVLILSIAIIVIVKIKEEIEFNKFF
jgi:hypothetical protein